MAPQLGKRKRVSREELERPSRSPSPSEGSDNEDMQELFRRAFEKKFKPLAVEPINPKVKEAPSVEEDVSAEEAEESDWSGLSDDDTPKVEVVEYKDTRLDLDEEASKALKRAFMTSKPPSSNTPSASKPALKRKDKDADDSTDAANLKNDLALQKLLRDSHILSASSSGASTPTLTTAGAARHKSTDLHLRSLGAKGSVFTQKKMPMAQRKHMAEKARVTEQKRRLEAREGGIILEKEVREKTKDRERKRERGVGGPSIGRFSGGTLTLSKKDVRSITGGPGSQGGKAKNGKGKEKLRR
ncbi:pre-rRNA processing and 40S ribosomal subunit assembly [Didymella pomorum]|uniref:Pre-rRNA processing and 40S ribosomal subunit assembly n=1 Tax=Didymella pomorum TaxID=749634 RepID=A0A9W8Z8D6_9PLEO|nr:pre-rRNA processing and 40S ribosomal subunit assembly [Didymella pomorum]